VRTRKAPWLCIPLAFLALAPAAHAGDPFVAIAETGAADPDVAIDENGNAHIAWVSDQASGGATEERLRYCIVGPAASACAPQTVRTLFPLTEPSEALVGDPSVFISAAGEVIVVSAITVPGDTGTRVFRSSNNFAPTIIGPLLGEHALGPGSATSLLSENTRQYFLGPFGGASASSSTTTLPGEPGLGVSGEGTRVTAFGGTRALVVRDTNSGTQFTASNGGNPNDAANWSAAQAISPSGDNPIVASGPDGVVLAYETGSASASQFQARTFDGAAFGLGVPISEGDDPIFPDLYADQLSGNFHFVYSDDSRDLRWVVSADGTQWSEPILIVREDQKPDTDPPAIGGGAVGGLVVWNGNPDTGPQTGTGKIWAARLTDIADADGDGVVDSADPCPDQAGSGGNGCPGGARCSEVNCAPPADGDKGNPTVVFGDARNTLQVAIPTCDATNLKARSKLKRRRVRQRSGEKVVTKVNKVVFKLGGRKKVDTNPPYKKAFRLRNAAPGTTYTMKTIVTLRVTRGDDPPTRKKLKLSRRFRICPGGLT
jgi:hypothetical protein